MLQPTCLLQGKKMSKQINLGPLLSFNYITLGLWRSKLFCRLTTFLNSLWACAGSSLYPILFLDLPGFCALILSGLFFFPDFPRPDFSPLCSHFGSYCHASKFQFIVRFLLHMHLVKRPPLCHLVHANQQRNFPYYFYPSPITWTNGSVVPWGDWKASSSCLLGY